MPDKSIGEQAALIASPQQSIELHYIFLHNE
ncbi:hypothetical protein BPC006_II1797 [Burkholderia pseudomallei BPC006]|nr:hypothetical protein BPC006_II1797 [Burkholderia pseudomallei BPC006]